jgi:hypothetical protein
MKPITTPKYLPDAEYDILHRVCVKCTWTGGQCESSGRQTTAQHEGGGVRQSTRADRYRRAAAAELLLLWECTPITHWEWVWALVQVWVWVWVWVWV